MRALYKIKYVEECFKSFYAVPDLFERSVHSKSTVMPNVWSPLDLRLKSQDCTGGHRKKCLGWTCGGQCSCILK